MKETTMSQYKILPMDRMFSNTEWQHESFSDDEYQRTEDEVKTLTIKDLESQGFIQVPPFFNRDGWYYDRHANYSWHEWKGTAWEGDIEQFKYELSRHAARILEPAEVKAIKTLMVYGSCPMVLRQLLWDHDNKMMTRNIYRNARMFRSLVAMDHDNKG